MSLFSKEEEPVRVSLRGGRELACVVCGCDRFFRREAQLHTAGLTFLKLEWTSPTADCMVCGRCGYVHWFLGSKTGD